MRIFPFLCLALVLTGCGARQQLTLGPEGAAELKVEMELVPAFSAYLADLSGLAKKDAPVIDPAKLRRELAAFPGLSVISAASTRTKLELHFKVADLADFFQARRDVFAGVMTVARNGAGRRLEVGLDREKIRRFLQFAPAEQRRLLEALLPPRTGQLSAGQYADYLAWAFEEYAEPKQLLDDLLGLKMVVTVGSPGRIVSQAGGRLVDGKVVFELPVLEIVSSEKTRRYSVVWE